MSLNLFEWFEYHHFPPTKKSLSHLCPGEGELEDSE